MQTPDDSLHDPIEELLGAGNREAISNQLRGPVFAQTIGVMRRRRRVRLCAVAASLLGCYLAGMATTAAWRHPGNVAPEVASRPAAPTRTAPEQPTVAVAQLDGFESWRRIGDHYLHDGNDISQALVGYSQALDLASDEELAITPGRDNWLLMALKDARVKERKHARIEQN